MQLPGHPACSCHHLRIVLPGLPCRRTLRPTPSPLVRAAGGVLHHCHLLRCAAHRLRKQVDGRARVRETYMLSNAQLAQRAFQKCSLSPSTPRPLTCIHASARMPPISAWRCASTAAVVNCWVLRKSQASVAWPCEQAKACRADVGAAALDLQLCCHNATVLAK